MTGAERGFLLLTSHLGIRDRKTMTVAMFRQLAAMVRSSGKETAERDLELNDLLRIGVPQDTALRIMALLSEEELLNHYLHRSAQAGCTPLTWVSRDYPEILRQLLRDDAPGVIWAKGDVSLLKKPLISLVGSRELRPLNCEFARKVGIMAAGQGYALVSGNARGADQEAQQACLQAGGTVISVVADDLMHKRPAERVLYLSEHDFDEKFSSVRAHSRNRLIHCLGSAVFVAQSGASGGTWSGTEKNLQKNWSRVMVFDDGTRPAKDLYALGAAPVTLEDIERAI